jgi:hypothetical protein
MEINSKLFVSPVDDFSCTICHSVFKEPIELKNCGHSFCKSCINKWLKKKKDCPCCRKIVALKDIIPLRKEKLDGFEGLIIRCHFASSGCDSHMALREMESHLKNCHFRKVECEEGCGKEIRIKDVPEHKCELEDILEKNKQLREENKRIILLKRTLSEYKKDNESKSKKGVTLSFKFSVDPLANKLFSKSTISGNLLWKIEIQTTKNNKNEKFLGIYLQARNIFDENEWTCNVSYDLILISRIDGWIFKGKDKIIAFDNVSLSSGVERIKTSFINLSDLTNPYNGYIKENCVIVKATIRAKTQFVDRDINKPSVFVRAINNLTGKGHGLSFKKDDIIEKLYPIGGRKWVGKMLD